jgi:condensin complex subunit 3
MVECVSSEKDLVKELKRMADHLVTIDRQHDQELLQDEVNLILGNTLYFFFDMPRLKG